MENRPSMNTAIRMSLSLKSDILLYRVNQKKHANFKILMNKRSLRDMQILITPSRKPSQQLVKLLKYVDIK
jgi:hypothetical protein